MQEIEKKEKDLEFGFELFNIKYSQIEEVYDIKEIINNLNLFWGLYKNFRGFLDLNNDKQIYEINTDDFIKEILSFK